VRRGGQIEQGQVDPAQGGILTLRIVWQQQHVRQHEACAFDRGYDYIRNG
jgi:hypothetical protein